MIETLQDLGLVDLLLGGAVVASLVGGLRNRRGLLGSIASAVGTALLGWVVAAALMAWGPDAVQPALRASRLLELAPPPVSAVQQLYALGSGLVAELDPRAAAAAG